MQKREILRYAYEYTNFYHEKYHNIDLDAPWEEFPVTTKQEIAHGGLSVLPSQYFSKLGGSDIITDYTSGSTGEYMETYTTKAEQKKSMLSWWLYRKKYYGIDTSSKLCYFFTFHRGGERSEFEYRKNGLGISKEFLTEDNLEEIFEEIYRFEPQWMLLQPSVAMILARYLFETGTEPVPSLKYIELSGEMFTEQQGNFIGRAFQVLVASQYGCNEMGTIAYQCPFGNLHVMEHNVHVEILNNGHPVEEEEDGNIIVTAKNNLVMPLVKYNTGDIGRFRKVQCKCGNRGAVIQLKGARKDDLVMMDDGTAISASFFHRVFQEVQWGIEGRIFQYRVEQKKIDVFVVSVATDEEQEKIESLFRQSIKTTRLSHATFQFRYYRYLLPEKQTGKLKFFICNAGKD